MATRTANSSDPRPTPVGIFTFQKAYRRRAAVEEQPPQVEPNKGLKYIRNLVILAVLVAAVSAPWWIAVMNRIALGNP